jgi:hypothetical protein
MQILLISPDLVIQSRVAAAAARAGLQPPRVIDWQEASRLEGGVPYLCAILDLSIQGLDVARTVAALRERLAPGKSTVAFAPHVHTARLAAAREAGCDRVLSRGQFDREADAIIELAAHRDSENVDG